MAQTYDEWREFARQDDCLDRMVPGDLRAALTAAYEAGAAAEREKLEHRLAAAYQRGAHWWIENGKNVDNAEFISKTSYDYADKIIAALNK
jgi:hypothetical protein